jgi:hypothetical protein
MVTIETNFFLKNNIAIKGYRDNRIYSLLIKPSEQPYLAGNTEKSTDYPRQSKGNRSDVYTVIGT